MAGLVVAILWGVTVSPLAAQSLGDVARREAARRNDIAAPAKVLTNADMPSSAIAVAAESEDAPAAPAVARVPAAPGGAPATSRVPGADAATPTDDESGWRARAAQVNSRHAEAQANTRLLKALADRLSLEMQASNPQIAARAAGERAALTARIREAESAEAAALEAQQMFQGEARAAGVPPAWIQ